MLFALAHPVLLVLLVASFLAAVTVHGVVQTRLLARAGDRTARAQGLGSPVPLRHVDPFGAVVTLLAIGWGRKAEPDPRRTRSRSAFDVAMLAPALLLVAVGTGLLAGFAATFGRALGTPSLVLRGSVEGVPVGAEVLLAAGTVFLLVGLLELVPVPPLDGGHVLFAHGGHTRGWQQARQWFLDQSWGVAVLLLLAILPIGPREAPLLFVLDQVSRPFLALAALAA